MRLARFSALRPAPRLLLLLAFWAGLAAALLVLPQQPWHSVWGLSGLLILALALLDLRRAWQRLPLSLSRSLPSAFSLHQRHPVQIRVSGLQPGEPLLLADHHPGDDHQTGLPAAVSGHPQASTSEFAYHYRPRQRGPVQFGPIEIWRFSPLQLWQCRQRQPASMERPVYPDFSRFSPANLNARHALISGSQRQRPRRGEGLEFHQLRDYLPGDSLRQIDWKASARRQKMISREYQEEQNQQVIVMLDGGRRLAMTVGELSGLDHALNATLLLAWSALKQGDKAGAMLFSASQPRWIAPTRGHQGLNQLLNGVYDLYPSTHHSDFSKAAQQLLQHCRRRALVVLVTRLQPEDNDELLTAVTLLRRHHLVLVADMLLPEQQALEQQDLGNGSLEQQYQQAVTLCAHYNEQQQRRALHTRLRHAGALVTASEPAQLPERLSQLYLGLKRSGQL